MKHVTAHALLNVRVPMRDGVELGTHVYLPDEGGPFPALLTRTPYEAISKSAADSLEWPSRGYAYVKQDTRGCFLSDGEYVPWLNEKEDGEDTLKWLAEQPWCNGHVAMYGGSYVAATQIAAAESGHAALRCFTPCLIGAEFYHTCYWGGAFRLMWQSRWTLKPTTGVEKSAIESQLPLMEADIFARGEEVKYWRDAWRHPQMDDFWKPKSFAANVAAVQAPAFIRSGWFDHFICDVFDLFNGLKQNGRNAETRKYTRILIGPWPHEINKVVVGEADFGEAGKAAGLYPLEIAFIDHFTSGRGDYDVNAAPVRLFIMGANVWRDEYEWPLARTVWTDFFLGGNGRLGATPHGEPDQFDYDPANPVPTCGGSWDFENVGPRTQTEIEARPDVLIYTSEALAEDMEATGPVKVTLYASSSAIDTDFTAKLVDVDETGKPLSVTDGILRAQFRHGNGAREFLTPGEVTEFTIRCNPTAYVFKKGHRLRVQISSSNFPAFARNLNTGNPPESDREMQVAHQTIFHTAEYPSRIALPLIPLT